ncbi:protein YgfX [Perlucidibaca piscinae]|uniref:protein YgfX n=1 Tax=Perlucidibaca piscinae TaxID=392589 RepID=UPI0003B30E8C|nr:protein YgfX [Perlucidibaca piscinae]
MSCSGVWQPEHRFRASRLARLWCLALLLLALPAIACSHAPLWLQGAAAVLVAIWAGLIRWQSGRVNDADVRACRQIATGWRLTLVDGSTAHADLHGPVRDARHLLCLAWREQAADLAPGQQPRIWRLALWSDQLPADDWRRLRVSLRWRSRGPESTARALARSTAPAPARCPG